MAIALPTALEHSFTPDEEPQSLDVVGPVYDRLLAMPVQTAEEVEAFLSAWNETTCWLRDHISKSRVATSCYTKDEAIQARWGQLISEVFPELDRRGDELSRKLLASPQVEALEETDYRPFLRQLRTDVELFREENVELQQRLQEMDNDYQRISGSWSVDFDGEPRTMSGMRKYLADPDRTVREAAWRAIGDETSRTSDQLEDLFEQMLVVRHEVARNAGFDNFRDYVFAAKYRDYDAAACHNFAEVTAEVVTPLAAEMVAKTCEVLGLDSFRPWDSQVDPVGGAALHPFDDTETLKSGVERMMRRLDEELGDQFAAIRDNMDLDARPGKAQGGFMTWYAWDQRPFIFANAAGTHTDIVTLLHEAGHAFHGLLANAADASPMRSTTTPMEFNEVASMAMELLHYETLDEFYDADDAARAIQQHLRRVVRLFPSVMRGDQFQHWLYTNPGHTREERRAKWIELNDKYVPYVDRSGIDEDLLADSYHPVLHFFVVPFYYIEYAFAQFGALQVAMNAAKDRASALAAYKAALALGPRRDVRGLYAAAGADFDPTPATLSSAMDWIREQLR